MNKFFISLRSFLRKPSLKDITEKQLNKNIEVIKSLRDYDEGKKDISTDGVERYLSGIRITPK